MQKRIERLAVRAGMFGLILSGLCCTGCSRKVALSYDNPDSKGAEEIRQSLDLRAGASASGGSAPVGDPTGFATLKGVFKLSGAAPAPTPLVVDKDLGVCAPGGRQAMSEGVVAGPSGGLANVLLFLATPVPKDDPRWEHESFQSTKTAEVVFDQKACVFLSHVFAMRSTQKMRVQNSDPVGHNTNLDSKRGAPSANFTVPGLGFAFYEPGKASPAPFPVSCSIHPWMQAYAMVCDSPYFAVTNLNGEFEIPNVPAGVPLEFRVWHEKTTLQQVTVNGQAAKWPKGKLAVKLEPGIPQTLDVTVDASVFKK